MSCKYVDLSNLHRNSELKIILSTVLLFLLLKQNLTFIYRSNHGDIENCFVFTFFSSKNFYPEMHSYADRLQNTSIAKRLVISADWLLCKHLEKRKAYKQMKFFFFHARFYLFCTIKFHTHNITI